MPTAAGRQLAVEVVWEGRLQPRRFCKSKIPCNSKDESNFKEANATTDRIVCLSFHFSIYTQTCRFVELQPAKTER
jgi:hypothetical protein